MTQLLCKKPFLPFQLLVSHVCSGFRQTPPTRNTIGQNKFEVTESETPPWNIFEMICHQILGYHNLKSDL